MSSLPSPLLVDQFAPRSEFSRTDHVVVDADPASTYKALHDLDLTELDGTLVNAAIRLRELPEWWRARKQGGYRHRTRMTINDLTVGSDWVLLGENPGHEIVFGAIGKFAKPVIEWALVEARDFTDFREPGYSKVVCSISTLPYGQRRTLVTVEVRVILTDPREWLGSRRFWRLSTPFVGVVSRGILRTLRHTAETGGLR